MAVVVLHRQAQPKVVAATRSDLLGPLLAVTLLTAGAEVVLLRLISRIGVHIPAFHWARAGYDAAVAVGTIAFPMATVFAASLVALIALRLIDRARPVAAATLILLGFQGWLLVVPPRPAGAALHDGLLAAALVTALILATMSSVPRGFLIFLGFVVAGQVLAEVQAASAQLGALGGSALPLGVAGVGEALLLVALLALPVTLAPPSWPRVALLWGVIAMLLAGGALAGNDSTTRILAIWTFGLQMVAPAPLYMLAAGALTATAIAHWKTGRVGVAAGLALLALGGFAPPSSYQADLMLAGVLLLAFGDIVAVAPRNSVGRSVDSAFPVA